MAESRFTSAPGSAARWPSRRARFLAQAVTTFGAIAVARGRARAAAFEYKWAHDVPLDHPMHVYSVLLSDAVYRESGGRLRIRVFPNGMLGGQSSVLAQLRLGAIQFQSVISSVFSQIVPVVAIDSIGFAFRSSQEAIATMDGPLGDLVRREFDSKGLYVPKGAFYNLGMRQLTASTKPIRTAGDLAGFKIRTPPGKIVVDMFQTLGASPIGLSGDQIYTSCQTHLIEGTELPYVAIESYKLFEVQKYVSISNHLWGGAWCAANAAAWKALPPDIQTIVETNAAKYAALEQANLYQQDVALSDKLRRQNMVFNAVDVSTMRRTLGPYYSRWKAEFGATAWDLLEASVGRLG